MEVSFTKMHGLGNDFVVINATEKPLTLSSAQVQRMSNRRFGVGFDQLLVLQKPTHVNADFCFRIFNADGGEVEQCGNGARCMALYIRSQGLSDKPEIRLQTLGGLITLSHQGGDKVTVEMGIPTFEPSQIPFITSKVAKTYEVKVADMSIPLSVVNVGNPHAVIVVDELLSEQVQTLGQQISSHEQFPEGVNVEFMQVVDPQNIRLQVYERGAGATLACGTGACAAMVVGRRNGLLQERVMVNQPGGSLYIDWQGPETMVKMTGPGKLVYHGVWVD